MKKSNYSITSSVSAKILASDSIEPKVFKDRGHELIEKPGIKKDELLKIIHEYDGIVVRSATKVTNLMDLLALQQACHSMVLH